MSIFCKHRWKEKERFYGKLIGTGYSNHGEDGGNIIYIIQECTKCGKLKKIRIP